MTDNRVEKQASSVPSVEAEHPRKLSSDAIYRDTFERTVAAGRLQSSEERKAELQRYAVALFRASSMSGDSPGERLSDRFLVERLADAEDERDRLVGCLQERRCAADQLDCAPAVLRAGRGFRRYRWVAYCVITAAAVVAAFLTLVESTAFALLMPPLKHIYPHSYLGLAESSGAALAFAWAVLLTGVGVVSASFDGPFRLATKVSLLLLELSPALMLAVLRAGDSMDVSSTTIANACAEVISGFLHMVLSLHVGQLIRRDHDEELAAARAQAAADHANSRVATARAELAEQEQRVVARQAELQQRQDAVRSFVATLHLAEAAAATAYSDGICELENQALRADDDRSQPPAARA